MQRWPTEGDKETPRSGARVGQEPAQRKDVKQIIADLTPVLRGLGNYFRTAIADREFNKMDGFVVQSLRRWQYRLAGKDPRNGPFSRGSAIRNGSASLDGRREISDASHTQKIIAKPWAGKRHARFERGN
jgi:RNA-directed DNA polymerase